MTLRPHFTRAPSASIRYFSGTNTSAVDTSTTANPISPMNHPNIANPTRPATKAMTATMNRLFGRSAPISTDHSKRSSVASLRSIVTAGGCAKVP
ncbi:MAG TPA: hypothetical protein VNI20_10530 [Fimbriimonadaceae bacterium]|nr:hypothetical protein [Fimbriimonadaceae bacterium]